MTFELLRLDPRDRAEFVEVLERIAHATDDASVRFIRSLPFAIGLTIEEPQA